jgi:hypothetical protein
MTSSTPIPGCGVTKVGGGGTKATLCTAGTLRVFTQSELNARHSTSKAKPIRILAPAHLNHLVLTTDGIGVAVQHVRRSYTASERTIDTDIIRGSPYLRYRPWQLPKHCLHSLLQ